MFFLERFASFAAAYAGPDVIEVFGRRTAHAVSTSNGGPIQTEHSTQWQILVTSLTPTSSGTAVTTDLTDTGLRSTVELARLLRRTVPAPPRPERTMAPLPVEPIPDRSPDPDPLCPLHEAADSQGTVAYSSVTHGAASVWLADSTGRTGCYATEEAHLVLRSPTGARGTTLAATPDDLEMAVALADLAQEQAVLALPRTTERTAYWLMLTPRATAQLLSHLAAGFTPSAAPLGERVGSDAVTLVDLPGTVLFDDEGVPASETTIVRSGLLTAVLSEGHARRRDWDCPAQAAPTNLVLRPHGTASALPSGVGLLVTGISGVRATALDLWRTPLRLTLHGATLRGGEPAERACGVVEASAQQILTGVVAVAGPVRNFRVAGLFGGATCVIDGLPSRLV